MNIPIALKKPKQLTLHNHTRTDNYFWLNERGSVEVESYLNAENSYTAEMMADVKPLEETIYSEIVARIKQTDMSVPYFDNGYYYYTRYEEGQEYPLYCRKKDTPDNAEQIILNVNELAKGHAYYQLAGISISPDNRLAAFGVDTVGRRIYTLHFKNLETGEILPETLENTTGGATWGNDNQTLFYSEKDGQTLRPWRILKYKLGKELPVETIYTETDEAFRTYVYKSRSKKYIILGASSSTSDEYRILKADHPDGEFRLFQARNENLEYSIGHFENKFYVRTNLYALNFRLMETTEDATGMENWKEVIPHRPDVLLESFMPFRNFSVLEERIKGNNKIRIISNDGSADYHIDFGEDAYTAWISVNPGYDTELLRIGYSSLTTPSSVYDLNMKTRERILLKRQEVVGGYEPDEYQCERVYATASDGAEIPISLVYKKSYRKAGPMPLLIFGYGAYGHTMDPYFSSTRLSLLDRGFVFAIAHVRGGQFLGRKWYEDGKLLKKKNTFEDYIACCNFLIENKYTSREKLFGMGGSAGGLLIGAVINSNPGLFRGVIAAVPFVDIVTTMLDESIPLTTGEYEEWGNPNEKEYYEYMLSYSPYDNVKQQQYPNMFVTAGYHDSQVQYWEPAKWVAKLRELKTDNNLLLLKTNMEAGHGGASGRFEQFRETASEYAFLFKVLGVQK